MEFEIRTVAGQNTTTQERGQSDRHGSIILLITIVETSIELPIGISLFISISQFLNS
jgi:hypothetical protein